MRIAVAQIASSTDPQQNIGLVREYALGAQRAGAELAVFPEATMASFATRSSDVAEPLDGPWVRAVAGIARQVGIAMVVGLFTPGTPHESGRPRARNTVVHLGHQGEVLARYDKIHLYDAWGFEESRHVEPGSSVCLTRVGEATLGITICYDIRFPELFKHLAVEGAEVIVVPASWAGGPGKAEQWRGLCVARALDSTCFVVAAGQANPATVGLEVRPGSPTGVGHSVVVSPLGEVLAEAGEAPELLVVDLDLTGLADARARLPVLATSRFTLCPP